MILPLKVRNSPNSFETLAMVSTFYLSDVREGGSAKMVIKTYAMWVVCYLAEPQSPASQEYKHVM